MGFETISLILIGLVVLALAVAARQILAQQGRLLMRLDQVERHLELTAAQAVERGTLALQAGQPGGLPVGTEFPDFKLPDLEGREVSLGDLRGRRVLLINWSARCGFCDQIGPDLAKLQADFELANVRMLLVSDGPADSERECAREHGLTVPILLQGSAEVAAFDGVGTPAAYLLDEEGKVARPLAIGASEVPVLAAEALPGKLEKKRRLRPLAESRIEREGLAPGTPAPDFTLPEVHGGEVSLAAHRGRNVLLVFSDPHCGPCDDLAPHLARLHEEHRNNGLDLLLVGRGDPEENRRKAERLGIRFPVLLQRKWEISRRYGIFATPVGFLIDEQGVIVKGVAKGVDEILALVPGGTGAEGARHERQRMV